MRPILSGAIGVMAMEVDLLLGLPLFAGMDRGALAAELAAASGRLARYASEQVVARRGESVRAVPMLVRGRVRAMMEGPDAKRLTVDLLEAPVILASAFVFSDRPVFPVTVEALSEAELLWLNRDYFAGLLSRHPSVMLAFVREVSNKTVFLSERLGQLALQDLRARLLGLLARRGDVGTQEEMAQLLGVARPSVARVLARLLEEGTVRRCDGRYVLDT